MTINSDTSVNTNSDQQKTFRVVAIGGAGAMGRWALRTAAQFEQISELVVADINIERAETVARELGAPAVAQKLDVTDTEALKAILSDADIVLNTMGPFAIFATPILRASIEAGCHYLDIDDDWESTVEALEFDQAAQDAGVSAIIGLGASPGVSNYLAVKAAQQLDTVDTMLTGWNLGGAQVEPEEGDSGSPSAALEHWLVQSSGTIRTWEHGAWNEPMPLREVPINYPGIGEQTVFTCGHPEPITLAPNLNVSTTALNVMSGPPWVFKALGEAARQYANREISLEEADALLDEARADRKEAVKDPLPGLWALATGLRDGVPTRASAHIKRRTPGRMGGATGIPLAVGLELLMKGKTLRTGVIAPEEAFTADDFFERYENFLEPARDPEAPLITLRSESDEVK